VKSIKGGKSILCISDMHQPWAHPDLNKFLLALKAKYKPDQVICVGDEIDSHAMSFHDSDPDLPSAGDELLKAIECLQPIYRMFPKMELVDSNHGSMVYRKGKHHGIPRKYLRDYGEVLNAPKGWTWHNNIMVQLPNGQSLFVTHGIKANGMQLAQQMGCNVLQGHYHTAFQVQYSSSPSQLYWSLQVGCLINDKALAFEYNKTTVLRPIIGLGIIINSQPKLLPMLLNKEGRWTGFVP
jgi:hypothetical protein